VAREVLLHFGFETLSSESTILNAFEPTIWTILWGDDFVVTIMAEGLIAIAVVSE